MYFVIFVFLDSVWFLVIPFVYMVEPMLCADFPLLRALEKTLFEAASLLRSFERFL